MYKHSISNGMMGKGIKEIIAMLAQSAVILPDSLSLRTVGVNPHLPLFKPQPLNSSIAPLHPTHSFQLHMRLCPFGCQLTGKVPAITYTQHGVWAITGWKQSRRCSRTTGCKLY